MSAIIKSSNVRLAEPGSGATPAPAMPAGRSAAAGAHDKRVELVRVGQRVHALELTCSCGETTLIELDYPETEAPGGAAG